MEMFQDMNCSLQSKKKKFISRISLSSWIRNSNHVPDIAKKVSNPTYMHIRPDWSAFRTFHSSRRNRIVERYFRHLSPPESFSRDGIRCSNRAVSRWFLRFGTAEPTSALLGHNRRRCIDFSFIRCCCCSHGALPLHRDRVDTCQLSFPSLSSLYSHRLLSFLFFLSRSLKRFKIGNKAWWMKYRECIG